MTKIDKAHKNFIESLQKQEKSPATVTAYNKDIEQLVTHLLSQSVDQTSDIQLVHLDQFMKKLSDEGYTNKSISRKTNATRTFIKYLFEEGHISVNIALELKHPKVDPKAPRILSKLEYRALRDASRNDIRSYAMIEVLLQTGVTISELAGMKLSDLHIDINKNEGTLFIPKRYSKDSRTVPVNKAAIEAVNNYVEKERPKKAEAEHVFITKSGKPLLIRNIRATINRYFKLAGVEKAKVNDLRHTFVAHHLASGVEIGYLSRIAGHKRISTTEKYLNYIEKTVDIERTELIIL